MIELSGRSEIGIEFCGLRCGEKLYEELLIDDSDKKHSMNQSQLLVQLFWYRRIK